MKAPKLRLLGLMAALALSLPLFRMPISVACSAPGIVRAATRQHAATAADLVGADTDSSVADSSVTSENACLPPNAAHLGITVLAEGAEPALSKNGKMLAFVRNNALRVMELDSRRQRTILDLDNPHSISWSPDGRRLAYQAGAPFSIWLVDADGSRLRQLIAPAPGEEDQYPTWSPDGRSVVWTHGAHLWIADTSGSRARPLIADSKAAFEVACDWSPDGQTILYSAAPDFTSQYQLRLVQRDGNNDRPDPTGVCADHAQWSRDGKAIYFNDGYAICRMEHLSGGKTTKLPRGDTLDWIRLALAPDQSFLLHDCISADDPDQIILMPLR